MHSIFDYSSMGLILLMPTSLLWVAIGLEELFQIQRPLKLLVGWSPKIAYVGIGLILPFYTIGHGFSAYAEINANMGLVIGSMALIYFILAFYHVFFASSESV